MKKKIFTFFLLGLMSISTPSFAETTNEGIEHLGHIHEHYSELIQPADPILIFPEEDGLVSTLAIVCPVYEDGRHIYTNKVYIKDDEKKTTHYENINGNLFSCTITTKYKIYRRTCACGDYTASSTIWEQFGTPSHKLN